MENSEGFYSINGEDLYPIDEDKTMSVKEARLDIEGFVGHNPEEINKWDMLTCEITWYMIIIDYSSLSKKELENEKNEDMIYIIEIIKMLCKRIESLGGKIDKENLLIIAPEENESQSIVERLIDTIKRTKKRYWR